MFEVATIRRLGEPEEKGDVGRILDAALYYGRIHLVMDLQFITKLIGLLGVADARALLNHPTFTSSLTIEFRRFSTGVA